MRARTMGVQMSAVLFAGAAVLASTGCADLRTYLPSSPSSSYLGHRIEDLMDVVDAGITISLKPNFAAYYDLTPFIPIGYGEVDGYFVGLGGGKFGFMRHYERSVGVLAWGREEVGFGEFSHDDPKSLNFQRVGIAGIVHGLVEGWVPVADYAPTCLHYVHLGWVGAVGNLRYLQMVDFVLGWTGIDICFDDGKERGEWFGKSIYGWGSPKAESEPVAAKAKPKPVAAKPKVVPKDEDKGYHVIRGDRVLGRILRDKLDGSE